DLAVALENRRLDLADLLVQQDAHVLLAVEDRLPRFAHARGAERIGLARPAERRLRFLVRLENRLVGPRRRERRILFNLIQRVEDRPGPVCGGWEALLGGVDRLCESSKV